MDLSDILLIAIGLSMDCLAVAIASGMNDSKFKWYPILRFSLMFGFFQALMPFVGYLAGSTFEHLIMDYDHWFAFSILTLLGLHMVYAHFHPDSDKKKYDIKRWRIVFILSIATSIDALAAGFSFAFLRIDMLLALFLIFFITLIMSITGYILGYKSCCRKPLPAELIGGLFLIGIGTKILLEHTLA
jgi:manganese efflux pump family protein